MNLFSGVNGTEAVVIDHPIRTPLTPQMTLTGQQVKDLLEFVAPDDDEDQLRTQVTIGFLSGHSGHGLYAWLTEEPGEGAIALFDESAKEEQD